MNVDTGEFRRLTEQAAGTAALGRKISTLTGRVTVMGNHVNRLDASVHDDLRVLVRIMERLLDDRIGVPREPPARGAEAGPAPAPGQGRPAMKRWPLFLIAAPAAVAVWSGWVGLGALCGFGLVQPFPGIVSWHLDTAITLPVGVEAYGAYALGAWLTPGTPERARTFARRSALGALALGVLGQVIYHLLNAAHATRAPWPVVVLVSCLPVATLGFGAALTHLLRERVPEAVPDVPDPHSGLNGHREAAAEMFAADLEAGRLPGIRAIRSGLHVGQDKASQVQAYLSELIRTP